MGFCNGHAKKLILLLDSFSIVNLILGCILLNSSKVLRRKRTKKCKQTQQDSLLKEAVFMLWCCPVLYPNRINVVMDFRFIHLLIKMVSFLTF
jgi:hypothetical protein